MNHNCNVYNQPKRPLIKHMARSICWWCCANFITILQRNEMQKSKRWDKTGKRDVM